ncbi:Brefeldin A-inhibited guanine nucleotide-exchange protein 2 [Apostasia shenzhenica]|uniref:Brefeldin A-inhibited guanine nucleotide-exchange protein 2 n=1 Tax=Apostasia shenzhenica TaxID=1088818 RepID=A0A2I0AX00_9ASPA|nr:Brefeldin A-inhibited guanine nucleotide-exchange protein 2 [Apostasia shenzhenica]
MASSTPEVDFRLSQILVPALGKIIKNAASWRKGQSKLAHQCKSLIDRLSNPPPLPSSSPSSPPPSPGSSSDSIPGPLLDLSLADSELFLSPLISACTSGSLKLAEPALDCTHKLIAHSYLHGEADPSSAPDAQLLARLIDAACSCQSHADDSVELLVVKTLLSAVTSTSLRIHGDSLLRVVRTCYDLYLNSRNPVNQTTAKASLIQMLVIVFRRMEADSSTVPVQPIVVADLMADPTSDTSAASSEFSFVQGFITKIISDIDVVLNPPQPSAAARYDGAFESAAVENTNPADLLDSNDKELLDAKYWEISLYKTALEGRKDELGAEGVVDREDDQEVQIGNKLRRDAFLVFRALCKLSMKTPPKEALADPTLMRGKILALELLKILLENAGAVFRTSERFLGAIKQYLCLSLLKNSASTLMIIYQLSCSIFMSLVSRFRPGLKAEIGVFFPMIVLRVLENISQPNFQQKMIVLRFVEKLCVDSQILVDIFVNYDCDVHSPNIFERMVNGLVKTAQGLPPGSPTTLVPPQDVNLKNEAMNCLVAILKSMGDWMNKQLRIPDTHSEMVESNTESGSELHIEYGRGEASSDASDSHPEAANGIQEAASLEKRRAYKLELQEGISIFNQKPKKGIDFLINAKKVGNLPEEIAAFLKNTPGLSKSLIGDYLGEREGLPLKVMHAYVDSFDFQGMEFDEAIRSFLQGFRLPGEAQKIDRIMEKFAQRFCKCNPNAFSSADTAYVLAYSVIMLNTDAHNPLVKNKMSPEDFISNNRGIDDGKDLPEEYLRSLYERISKNEIKMKEDELVPNQKQTSNSNKMLGLDGILNIVIRKRGAPLETSDDLIRHMQEQFKEKARKTESVYYAATDVIILRFMVEVCWAPMLAAFSVPLDQSDEEEIISLCLEGFRYAIHVTAVMLMKTQRDAFVTSLAKFTSLHSAADIKQKNIDAIKAIFLVADEDGNYLQEAWEHILTCVSRFEHLHLLGEGAPPDATFFGTPQTELDVSKQSKPSILPVLIKKGPGQSSHSVVSARRGSYESVGVGGHASGVVTSEQLNNLVSNLNMLEQVGISEESNIFIRSEKLNSEAIVYFVKALCKVSLEELRSTSDPRIFSLTKIVEIAHYNMKRIRLVWSRIWHVLSIFFVTIGCSENLSIAIFAMDSLRQLAKKFIEREELANYNFQNEFLKPFVIVMRRSRAVEIRELIIRCVSQMVLACASSVKSGWKSMFMIFTTASYDDHKNIVVLAFEIIERILREYFPYITETETTTFTDCVNCLIAFTNSRFDKDISLKAIGFLRFCAAKLSEGELGSSTKLEEMEVYGANGPVSPSLVKDGKVNQFADKEDQLHLWFPLLAGLSELTFDLRPEIRKSALHVLFETLRNHGHHFSLTLWEKVFDSVLFPIFDYVRHAIDPSGADPVGQVSSVDRADIDQDIWLYETCKLALQLVVDLFLKFYGTVHPLLNKVLLLLTSFIKRPHQSLGGIGVAAFVRMMNSAGSLFTEDKWIEVVLSLKEAANATLPDFSFILSETYLEYESRDDAYSSFSQNVDNSEFSGDDDLEELRTKRVHSAVIDAKCRASIQLLLIQAVMEIYDMYRAQLSAKATITLFEAMHSVATNAHKINCDTDLRMKLQDLSSITQMQDPPLLRLENESYQVCLTLLQNVVLDKSINGEVEIEACLIDLCRELLQVYLSAANSGLPIDTSSTAAQPKPLWLIPLGTNRRRELAARAPMVVTTLQTICGLPDSTFEQNLSMFFPLLISLIRCEHGNSEVQAAVSEMLSSWVGTILLQSV